MHRSKKALLALGFAALALAGGVASPAAASVTASSDTGTIVAPAQITVRGVVSEGVERGCLILSSFNTGAFPGVYLLLGGDPKVIFPGAKVEVTGVVSNTPTTCQQGTPLYVKFARPI